MNPFSSYKELLQQNVLEQTTTHLLFPITTDADDIPCKLVSNKAKSVVAYPFNLVLNDSYPEASYDQVYTCVYCLTTTPYGSFVQYLLEDIDGQLRFLNITCTDVPGDRNTIQRFLSDEYLLTNTYFKGYYCIDKTLYIFIQSVTITDNCWATIYEICNARRYMSHSVDDSVTAFFISNPCFLTPSVNGKRSDIPVIGSYVSQPQGTILGNVCYFVLGCQYNSHQRCAIFLGTCKVVLSSVNSKIDKSISSQIAQLTNEITDTEILKLIDYNGEWRDDHDSIIIGRIRLTSRIFTNEPICGVKNPEQFICL